MQNLKKILEENADNLVSKFHGVINRRDLKDKISISEIHFKGEGQDDDTVCKIVIDPVTHKPVIDPTTGKKLIDCH